MSKKENTGKDTNRDVKPTRGQEGNENWDDQNNDQPKSTKAGGASNARRTDEETNTTGVGSSERSKQDNVAPLDADLEQLPSEKRIDRNNQTGPGIG